MTLTGLWTPNGTDTRKVIATCYACDKEFYEGEFDAAQKHMGPCATEHYDEMRAANAGLEIFQWVPDPEVKHHLEQVVGPRMVRERRLVMKPSERAGFS